MPSVLPQLTRRIDDDFMNTWLEIKADVEDQVKTANIMWLALENWGCFKPQPGGEYVTRPVGYGKKTSQRFAKGSVLKQQVAPADTMGMWPWRGFLVDVNRSYWEDRQNSGPYKIKDYVTRRIEMARTALIEDTETDTMRWGAYYPSDEIKAFNGLYDICPQYVAESAVGDGSASDTNHSGTSNGGLDRTNTWWRNWVMYDGATQDNDNFIAGPTHPSYEVNLVPDMRHGFNTITANQESPNFILTNQLMYEAYEDEASDRQQIVQNQFTRIAVDLGFEAQTFKGATFSWTAKIPLSTLHMFMLNMNYIEFVYHPDGWFDMMDWRDTPQQTERVTYIACMTTGLITNQPRRHGAMEYAS